MDLFELVGTIAIKNQEANKALDETSEKGVETQSKLSKAFSAVGKGAAKVGKAVGTGLMVGGAAMGALTIKALNMSGDLEQNMGGSEQVFKQYAASMQETAKKAFSSMGLSTNDFLGTANKMGALFQGAGFSIKESSELSTKAMQRAADVASIMGIDVNDAMEAIAGAAKGNFTMMDNLGVAMNDTAIQNYALSKGIKKSTAEMTQQEKIGLAMEMFLDKTSYAAGNYARENETLAGSLGTAKAALSNFLDGSGDVNGLVDAFSNAANVIVDNLSTLAPRLVQGLAEVLQKVVPMIPPLLQQMLPVIITGAVDLMNSVINALPAVLSALMDVLPMLVDGLRRVIDTLIQALPQLMEMLVSALPDVLPLLIAGVIALIISLCDALPQIIQPIVDYLPTIIMTIVDALMDNLPDLIEGCVRLVVGIVQAMPQIMLSLIKAMPTIMQRVVDGLWTAAPILWDGLVEIATTYWNELVNYYTELFATISEWLAPIIGTVSAFFADLWDTVSRWVSNIWNKVKSTTTNAWNGIKSSVSNAVNGVKTTVSNVFDSLKTKVGNVWDGIKKAIETPINKAKDIVKNAIDAIKGFFDFEFKWPKLKMPHFAISPPGWEIGDLLKGSIPSLGIDWYAKAMNNPMLMTDPTIFGYNPATGNFMAGGEAGDEVVAGAGTLMGMIRSAVAQQTNGLETYMRQIVEMLFEYFPQMLDAMDFDIVFNTEAAVGVMAVPMNKALGKLSAKKGRGR